jgi:hypothetical protein
MARRHGPLLPSLKSDRALVAEKVMRLETADSHQGQEQDRSDKGRIDSCNLRRRGPAASSCGGRRP